MGQGGNDHTTAFLNDDNIVIPSRTSTSFLDRASDIIASTNHEGRERLKGAKHLHHTMQRRERRCCQIDDAEV